MPAKVLHRVDEEGIYSHIFNKGIDQKLIFNDKEDYAVFLNFLKEYLSPREEGTRKTFTVKGKTFKGIPHQPKNYFGQLELIAYSLMPHHFHLVLYQTTENSIKGLLRSLCTRYSMYFNKKYQRTGPLFEGPYKSVQAKDPTHLLYLSHYIHQNDEFSSYREYIGERDTSWIKPSVVLNALKETGRAESYKDFVQNHKLEPEEQKALEELIIENESESINKASATVSEAVAAPEEIKPSENTRSEPRWTTYLASTLGFFVLLGLGIRNIMASDATAATHPAPQQISQALPLASPQVEAVSTTGIKLIINSNDPAVIINIRQEPSLTAPVIQQAGFGATFDYISEDSGWYKVKLSDGTEGFVLAKLLRMEANP